VAAARGEVEVEPIWAVVTGGSDGVGLAMVHEMASQGFAVCIMARNLEKMQRCLEEIKGLYPSVQTKAVVCDFSEVSTMAEYREIVERDMATMNVAVLMLNAGVWEQNAPLHMKEDKNVETTIRVNGLHVIYLTKIFEEMMLKR